MNFLIDANLPRRIVHIFQERGHNAVHTLDLPEGMQQRILRFCITQTKIIVQLQPKIPISAHPSGCKTVPTNYY
jgi:predicted nuclease of predicted toxin-antitoxin system